MPTTAKSTVIAASIVALLHAAPAPSYAGAFDFVTEPILANGEWNNPTSIAIDESGVTHMAYMTQHHTDSNTKEIWYATDAGGQWSHTRITNNSVREEFPYLVLDAAGNVHIAFHTGTATSNMIRYVNNVGVPSKAPPGTFNPIIDITGSGYKIVKHIVDPAGTVHFTFTSQTASSDEVFYTTWNALSGVGPLVNISNSPGNEHSNDIIIDSSGDVHVVYCDGGLFGAPMVYRVLSEGVWTTMPTGVTSTLVVSPILLIAPGDVITIVHRISDVLYVIDDGGTGVFGSATPVYNAQTYRPSFYNKFAVDADGHRYIAFASNVNTLRGIIFIRETDSGFQEPVQLSATASGNQTVSIALNSGGKLAVSYSLSGVDSGTGFVYANISLATHDPAACAADISDGDNQVNINDLLAVINSWGPCPSPPAACDTDIDDDGEVSINDLLEVINAWGPCP